MSLLEVPIIFLSVLEMFVFNFIAGNVPFWFLSLPWQFLSATYVKFWPLVVLAENSMDEKKRLSTSVRGIWRMLDKLRNAESITLFNFHSIHICCQEPKHTHEEIILERPSGVPNSVRATVSLENGFLLSCPGPVVPCHTLVCISHILCLKMQPPATFWW